MSPNCRVGALLSLATILLLSGPVESCVNFKAIELGNNNGLLQIQLWDNGPQVCSLTGYPSHDQFYELNCDSGYGATFDRSATLVSYSTDHGAWTFLAPGNGLSGYTACVFACDRPGDCFV